MALALHVPIVLADTHDQVYSLSRELMTCSQYNLVTDSQWHCIESNVGLCLKECNKYKKGNSSVTDVTFREVWCHIQWCSYQT